MRTLNEQIQRLRDILVTCYNAIAAKGGTIPEAGERNMTNLPAAVDSIPQEMKDVNLEELTITENGTYTPQEGVDGFSQVVASVYDKYASPLEYKDVTFIDHRGVVADYTIEEIMALTALPTPREFEHLTFDYWTKTLDDVQDGQKHIVAAIYHTTDGSFRFGWSTEFGLDTAPLIITATGDITIDWGDGNIENGPTMDFGHTYADNGIYDVVISGGVISFVSWREVHYRYPIGVTYIETPNTLTIYDFFNGTSYGYFGQAPLLDYISFAPTSQNIRIFLPSCMKCKFLAIPNSVNDMTYFKGTNMLECFNIPPLVTSFNNPYSWYNLRKIVFEGTCKSLHIGNITARSVDITIKEGVETISGANQCFRSRKIETPSSLLSIPNGWLWGSCVDIVIINGTPTFNGESIFRECKIKELHFTSITPPILSTHNVFYNYNNKVYIPLGAKETYENDTNWAAAIAAGYITLIEE